MDDEDSLKVEFKQELLTFNQNLETFKLKLGHKNLIINLCHELQKTNLEDFNHASNYQTTIQTIPDQNASRMSDVVVVKRKLADDEHGYSREDERRKLAKSENSHQQEVAHEVYEQVQYIYEDDEGSQFVDQSESEYVDDGAEIVEYQEVIEDDMENDGIYSAEQAVKQEADNYELNNFGDDSYATYQLVASRSSHGNVALKSEKKKPKHMYADEFLQTQTVSG